MWIEGRAVLREAEGGPGRSVTVALDLRGLTIRGIAGDEIATWPLGALVVRRGSRAFAIRRPPGDARVEIADPPTRAAFEAALKALPREGEPRLPRSWLAAAAVAAAVFAGLAVLVWQGLSLLAVAAAPLVPEPVVVALDAAGRDAALAGLGTDAGRRCTGAAGTAALDDLTRRLAKAGGVRPVDWSVAVYRSPVPNALALPAGTVVITDALLGLAATPDAFAGVLAHEIGHVDRRHGLRKLIHDGGLMIALSFFTGDAASIVAAGGRALAGAAYSRDAEREADDFAVAAVAAAGGDPEALGPFLARLDESAAATTGGLGGLLDTHPLSAERAAAIAARAGTAVRGAGPLLAAADWTAIRTLCGDRP